MKCQKIKHLRIRLRGRAYRRLWWQLWEVPNLVPCFKIKHCWHCFTFHDKTNLISLLKCFNLPLSSLGAQWLLHWDLIPTQKFIIPLHIPPPQNGSLWFSLLSPVKSFHWWPQVLNLTVLSWTQPTTFYEMNFLKSGRWAPHSVGGPSSNFVLSPATGFGVL